jgi:low affinity Fe/Cu permease
MHHIGRETFIAAREESTPGPRQFAKQMSMLGAQFEKRPRKQRCMPIDPKIEKLRECEAKRNFLGMVPYVFRIFARQSSIILGTAWAFAGAVVVVLVWLLTGPTFHFSDTWQLVINTATTVITFLMVFLIQNTQNRDAKAVHLKLDELIRALKSARNELVDLENLSDEELKKLEQQFQRLRRKAEHKDKHRRDVEPAASR